MIKRTTGVAVGALLVALASAHLAGAQQDLVASMQQNFPDIPVIAITGYSDIDTAINVLKHGAADLIAKPFELAALQESTRAALEKTRLDVQSFYEFLSRAKRKVIQGARLAFLLKGKFPAAGKLSRAG